MAGSTRPIYATIHVLSITSRKTIQIVLCVMLSADIVKMCHITALSVRLSGNTKVFCWVIPVSLFVLPGFMVIMQLIHARAVILLVRCALTVVRMTVTGVKMDIC